MTQQTTIRKLAELVNTPVEKLLEQLAEAGMSFSGPDQVVTSMEKVKLLGFLKRSHGKAEPAADDAAPKKITLARRKVQEVTVAAGRTKTTVNVEVRQKRTYVKSDEVEAPPSDERADALRKLQESNQRNLEEQQRLAETDRKRADERERIRQEEQAAREEAEAASKQAEANNAEADADAAAAATGAPSAEGAPGTLRPVPPRVSGHHVPKPPVRKDPPRGCTCPPPTVRAAPPRVASPSPSVRWNRAVVVRVTMVSSVLPHRWCVTSPLARASPWPTWRRNSR